MSSASARPWIKSSLRTSGDGPRVPSLVLGIEPTELRLEDGLSMLYGSSISWSSATRPATKEIYPARVYDLLVGDGRGPRASTAACSTTFLETRRVSVDVSIARTRRSSTSTWSPSATLETRIDAAKTDGRLEGWRPTLTEPNLARPADTLPQNVPEHMRLMLDLIVLAFQMDKTRIATCMLNNDLSQMNFGFLEGVRGSLHIDLTHNGKDPIREAMYLKTNQFHVAQFAYLIKKLREIDEGGQSLLDNSILMGCSNLLDGDQHQADEMPILLAGRGGGTPRDRSGARLPRSRGDDNRRACSLYLSIMDRMGVRARSVWGCLGAAGGAVELRAGSRWPSSAFYALRMSSLPSS